jgi:hypothetical protein
LAASARNGFTDGTNGTTVDYFLTTTVGASIRVTVASPHRNNFLSIVGMSSWPVSAAATALAGYPDTAYGAAPMIFSIRAFGSDGKPAAQYSNASAPYAFGDGNGDVPNDAGDIAWTNYGTGNLNTSEARSIIHGSLVINKTLQYGTYIGQHNNGDHTALFGDTDQYLSGKDVAVPVVDDGGNFQGWATFHVVSAAGGSSKTVTGYFETHFASTDLSTTACASGSCPRYLGSYVLKLVD